MATPRFAAAALLLAAARALVAPPSAPRRVSRSALAASVTKSDVAKCLRREYVSFFAPLESEYYSSSVTFDDPLSSLSGLDAYRGNVDMLGGARRSARCSSATRRSTCTT